MKIKLIFFLPLMGACFLLNVLSANETPIGKTFPEIELERLIGAPVSLPQEHATLLIICFEKECATQARDWVNAIRSEKLLPDSVRRYIVPVVGDSFKARVLKPFIISILKKRIPTHEHERIALLIHDAAILKNFLAYEEEKKELVHLTLIDKKGVVRWQHTGTLTSSTRQMLKKVAASL